VRFASLGSGSEGNGLTIQAGGTTLLLDCGFGIADTTRRLARLGLAPDHISAILVTHEHDDHVGGVARFALRHEIPVYLSHGSLMASGVARFTGVDVTVIDSHTAFAIGGLEAHPYPVPHDAREPTQFVFSDGAHALGVLTDAGASTTHIEAMLSRADALVLECNHDTDLLMNGDYPRALKQRIASRLGHLANDAAAALLAALPRGRLQHVIAAHLSRQNNTPQLARQALAGALDCDESWIGIATQDTGFDWRAMM
jgi:phosphoribosyl 1,2-cyclic phosphodiesterase